MATGFSVFEVAIQNVGELMAAYLAQFRQILSAYPGALNEGRSFEMMLDCSAFNRVPNSLDVVGLKIPDFVTGLDRSVERLVNSPLLVREERL